MIEAQGLTKRYGSKVAVDDVTFTVAPGRVTGFLGPNGAGKSTTMRAMLGLLRPDAGDVRYGGLRYRDLDVPMRRVGALLEAKSFHPGRTARNHLRMVAALSRVPYRRVDEVLELVGLAKVANRRAKGFSLGMAQRLGLATALLPDPEALILDEPTNGLDPKGITWLRGLLHQLAEEGRAILVSSHLLAEMAHTADHLVVIGRGRLIADAPVAEFVSAASGTSVLVRTAESDRLAGLVREAGGAADQAEPGALLVRGIPQEQVAEIAFRERVPIHELTTRAASLEEAFFEVTDSAVEFASTESASTKEVV